jgi:hypothetical protein
MRRRLGLVIVGMAASLIGIPFVAEQARANCYELIGCPDKDTFKMSDLMQLGCQPLWEVRNWIYKEHGYCFKTQKAIEAFGNDGCLYDDPRKLPLNQIERANVKALKKAEAKKGC